MAKGQSAGSLEEAIDYAMNRDKTERSVFEMPSAVQETAWSRYGRNEENYHKMDGYRWATISGARACQRGKVAPNWHTRMQAWSWQKASLQRKYIGSHHHHPERFVGKVTHNHIVFNSVSMEDGKVPQQQQESS